MDNSDPNSATSSLAILPSKNYETARDTLVYSLAQLVFGSLLAAYVLGFASFGASALINFGPLPLIDYASLKDQSTWFGILSISELFRFAAISATYGYLTAAMYLQYHIGILTMPTAAVERSRFDFTIAVSQGLLFGGSMLFAQWHFLLITLILVSVIFRKNYEFSYLTGIFAETLELRTPADPGNVPPFSQILRQRSAPLSPRNVSPAREFDRKLRAEAKKIERRRRKEERKSHKRLKADVARIAKSKMPNWRPVGWLVICWTCLLAIFGIMALALPSAISFFFNPIDDERLRGMFGLASIVLSGAIFWGTWKSMLPGSRFTNRGGALDDLDKAYLKMEKELEKLVAPPIAISDGVEE